MSGNNGETPAGACDHGAMTAEEEMEMDEFMCCSAVPDLRRSWPLKLATVFTAEMALLNKAAQEGRLSHSRAVGAIMGHAAHIRALYDPRLKPHVEAFDKAWLDLAREYANASGTEVALSNTNSKEPGRSPSSKAKAYPEASADQDTAHSLEGDRPEDPFADTAECSKSDSGSDSASRCSSGSCCGPCSDSPEGPSDSGSPPPSCSRSCPPSDSLTDSAQEVSHSDSTGA